jgi:hypothetical protein
MTVFQIITTVDGRPATGEQTFETDDPYAAFDIRGFRMELGKGGADYLREELRGQPKFAGLCGPMWGGTDEQGRPIIRYEDWRSYDFLSR